MKNKRLVSLATIILQNNSAVHITTILDKIIPYRTAILIEYSMFGEISLLLNF